MEPRRLPDGRIRIPVRVDEGGIVGDGWITIGPEHAEFEAWAEELNKIEASAVSAEPPR